MPTPQQPQGDGNSGVRPSPQDRSRGDAPPPREPSAANDKTQPDGERPAQRPLDPTARGLEELLRLSPEPTDDSPTVISRSSPRPISSEDVFSGALRGRRLA